MSIFLEDPKTGKKAYVNDDNELLTRAATTTYIAKLAAEDMAFGTTTPMLTLATNTGRIFWMKNNSSEYDFRVHQLWFNWNGGNTSKNTVCYGQMYAGDSTPSANNTASGFGSMKCANSPQMSPDLLAYYWDGVGTGMTIDTPAQYPAFVWCGSIGATPYPLDGCVIVPPQVTLSFAFQGEEAGMASLNMIGFMQEKS